MRVSASTASRPPLDAARLRARAEQIPDLSVEVLDQSPSTNAVVAERAREGAADGLVVVTEHQTAGRGRLDRVWQTPPHSALTFSMLMRPTAPTRSWPWLPLLTGYAVAKALRADGYRAGLKWPNDVLIESADDDRPARKVAGILVERVETPTGPAAVVGVGLNTHFAADELPVETATSLSLEPSSAGSDEVPDRTTVLFDVLDALRETYDLWQLGGDDTGLRLQQSYTEACLTLGRQVRVDLPDGRTLQGRAAAIDPTGQLVVETDAGSEIVGAGDVVHVRAL